MMIMTKNTYIRPAVEVVAVDNGPALLADSASIEIVGTPEPISIRTHAMISLTCHSQTS